MLSTIYYTQKLRCRHVTLRFSIIESDKYCITQRFACSKSFTCPNTDHYKCVYSMENACTWHNSNTWNVKNGHSNYIVIIITRVSEAIMFTPCVFVCLFVCVCVYVCHDVCPDDLTMKDWCHTNNILQVHCWGCLFVQVMFHALMTSLMTSQDHKISQILKLIYLRQYLS